MLAAAAGAALSAVPDRNDGIDRSAREIPTLASEFLQLESVAQHHRQSGEPPRWQVLLQFTVEFEHHQVALGDAR